MISIAQTCYGSLRGEAMEGYVLFKGVPYAAPPTGGLRWRPPVPPTGWPGIRDATRFGPRCPHTDHAPGSFYQREFFTDPAFMPPMDEDCLYLNVWTPADGPNDRLPVAVWIHGGGYVTGSGCDSEFDGVALNRHGVVMVSINYRLNAFGFLAHPWLTAEAGTSGNYGVLDQLAALAWVRENIAAFGGDPGSVTIFGQSAGALSVQTLVSSPLAAGLAHRAVIQSAGGYNTGIAKDRTLAEAEALGERFAALCGVTSPDALRALSADALVRHVEAFLREARAMGEGLPFGPVIDGRVLTMGYDVAIDGGAVLDIPYMIGCTENDIGSTPEMIGAGEKSRLYKGCVAWSLKMEALGRNGSYVYYFTHKPLGDDAGAFHCAELWYMFGLLHRSWRPKNARDYALEGELVCRWANFIKGGSPNGEGLTNWPPCVKAAPYVKVFD